VFTIFTTHILQRNLLRKKVLIYHRQMLIINIYNFHTTHFAEEPAAEESVDVSQADAHEENVSMEVQSPMQSAENTYEENTYEERTDGDQHANR
jgi:hypothetical protein